MKYSSICLKLTFLEISHSNLNLFNLAQSSYEISLINRELSSCKDILVAFKSILYRDNIS